MARSTAAKAPSGAGGIPCPAGPTMSPAVIVPWASPEVACVHTGFPPPPPKNSLTPPVILGAPKWMWLCVGRVVNPLHSRVYVIVVRSEQIFPRNVATALLVLGVGVSFNPDI